jgi:hypothetical protein
MAKAKLTFVGSATLTENHLDLLGTDQLQAQIKKQPTQRLKQLFQDLAVNQRFRRDIFVRGHAQLNRAAIQRNMESLVFGASRDLTDVANVAKVARGEVKFDEKGFAALKDAFTRGTWSVAELRPEMARQKSAIDLERTLNLMTATGIALPCAVPGRPRAIPAEPRQIKVPSETNRALFKRLADNLISGNAISVQAGSALGVDPVYALIITLLQQPWKTRDEAKARLAAEVTRRRIRFNRGPSPAEKDGAGKDEAVKSGATTAVATASASATAGNQAQDDVARGAQFFDKFFASEAPVLHRLGVIELV